jgi:hypothetical protein
MKIGHAKTFAFPTIIDVYIQLPTTHWQPINVGKKRAAAQETLTAS